LGTEIKFGEAKAKKWRENNSLIERQRNRAFVLVAMIAGIPSLGTWVGCFSPPLISGGALAFVTIL
jgi:hypothetical protein